MGRPITTDRIVAWLVLPIALGLPATWLVAAWAGDRLGANPLETLIHTTGRTALWLLVATLAITPLRRTLNRASRLLRLARGKRMSDWNWLVRWRRTLGLACFAYACAHFWIYASLDLGFDWRLGWTEILEKPYLAAGTLALFCLAPLAATSNAAMMRRLGRHWKHLHRLTYGIAVVCLAHFWWMKKPGDWSALPETLAVTVLLGQRLLLAIGWSPSWDGADGGESLARETPRPAPLEASRPNPRAATPATRSRSSSAPMDALSQNRSATGPA